MTARVRLICIVGHTASGKSSLAMDLARKLPAGLLSVDSMQVYRGFDIGTAKPTAAERKEVRHFGLDLCDPGTRFSAGRFMDYARQTLAEEAVAGRTVLAVGGTGLYLKAMLHGLGPEAPADDVLREELRATEEVDPGAMHRRLSTLDPVSAARLHPNDRVRCERALEVFLLSGEPISVWQERHRFSEAPFETMLFGIRWERSALRRRISARIRVMLQSGWIEEVRTLLDTGVTEDMTAMIALGYRDIAAHLRGECDAEAMFTRIERASHRFAKRQTTWFNREPSINWLDPAPDLAQRLLPTVEEFLSGGAAKTLEP
jgi:tRNA dimethylallyltransferase